MYIRIDEAGDFSYRDDGLLRVSVIAGVVIPDKKWPGVSRFVDEHKRAWDMPDELKANSMSDEQLLALAEFIVAENLTVSAIATDSEVFTAAAQQEEDELVTFPLAFRCRSTAAPGSAQSSSHKPRSNAR